MSDGDITAELHMQRWHLPPNKQSLLHISIIILALLV